jgi:hypothetical protein
MGKGSLPPFLTPSAGTYVVDTRDPNDFGPHLFNWQASIDTSATLDGFTVDSKGKKTMIEITGCTSTTLLPVTAGPDSFVYVIDPLTLTPATYALPLYEFAASACANLYDLQIASSPPFTWTNSQINYLGTMDTSQASVQTYTITASQTNACSTQTPLTNSSY